MIKSMTGFASVTGEEEQATVAVTIRAQNHRYLDLQMRVPQSLGAIEADVRALVARHVGRGRIELSLSLQLRELPGVDVEFNEQFGRALEAALGRARARGLISGDLTPGDLLRLPQAITIRDRQSSEEPSAQDALVLQARATIDRALIELDAMRVREGEHLRTDLDERRALVADLVERIAAAADEGRAALAERLRERIAELRAELTLDEAVLAQEVVRWAARSDISEEVARFRAPWTSITRTTSNPSSRKRSVSLAQVP